MQYNTSRELMKIKEYGRGIHNMVKHLMTIEDRELRQKNAEAIIEIMAILSPQQKAIEDYKQKLWDHLFLISEYKLDVDCPFPIPTQEHKERKPEPLPYPKSKIKWNHFGKKFEDIFEKAIVETDEEKKQGYIQVLFLFMKIAYTNWHKESIHDDMLRDELASMSKGKLIYEPGSKFVEFVDVSEIPTISGVRQTEPKMQQRRFFNNRNNNNGGNRNGNNNMNRNGMNPNSPNRNNKFNKFKKKNNNNS
jgi:hypothetical protein